MNNIEKLNDLESQLREKEKQLTHELIIQYYERQIAELDRDYLSEMECRQKPSATVGKNQKELFQMVGENALFTNKYHSRREQLVRALDEIIGVSPAVQEYLDAKKSKKPIEYSKFDVDAGITTIDNSLEPLKGKEI